MLLHLLPVYFRSNELSTSLISISEIGVSRSSSAMPQYRDTQTYATWINTEIESSKARDNHSTTSCLFPFPFSFSSFFFVFFSVFFFSFLFFFFLRAYKLTARSVCYALQMGQFAITQSLCTVSSRRKLHVGIIIRYVYLNGLSYDCLPHCLPLCLQSDSENAGYPQRTYFLNVCSNSSRLPFSFCVDFSLWRK